MLLKGSLLALAAAGILAVVAFSGGTTASATQTPQVVELQALEQGQAYLFSPTELRVRPGAVTVRFSNAAASARPHTFDLKTKDGSGDIVRSDRVDAGKSLDVSFNVTEEGSYQFICLLPGHADRGQKGTLFVAGAAATTAPAAGETQAPTAGGGGDDDLLLISLLIHIPAVTLFVGLALWDAFVATTPGIAPQQRARMIGKTAVLTLVLIAIIMVTGVYQTIYNPFRSIESYSDLSLMRDETAYGMALFIKHAFVFGSFALSPFIRFYLAPRAGNVELQADGTAVASEAKQLQWATLLNLALGLGALLSAARMTIELH